MIAKNTASKCALVILGDGFSETEAIIILSAFRRAGMCARSVGIVSGLIHGAHGILIMPDLTLAELLNTLAPETIGVIVLPGDLQHLARLEQDPRLHRLIRQVAAHEGLIATSPKGIQIIKAASLGAGHSPMTSPPAQIVLQRGTEQPVEAFAQELVRRMGGSARN